MLLVQVQGLQERGREKHEKKMKGFSAVFLNLNYSNGNI